jgi:hypothetical protein
MSDSAHVTAIAAFNDLRQALVCFGEAAAEALSAAEAEIRRTAEWIEDQLKSWEQEVRVAEDVVFQAKTELTRRKMMHFGDRRPDTTDQELALRKAQARLEHAEDQVKITRAWLREWPQAILDYRGPSGQLQGLLEGELPRACAFLDRKTASLEAYAGLTAPSLPPPEAAPASGETPEEKPQP